jgi:hypothetical protein
MSKRPTKEIRYPGMLKSQIQTANSFPLTLEQVPGRPDLVTVSLNVAMAAPDLAMYADYVQLKRVRDGVQMIFGKVDPLDETRLLQAALISFPYRAFVNQLYKSVVDPRPGAQRAFRDSVESAAKQFGYTSVAEMPGVTEIKQVGAFRSNFVAMALQEDDAAIDFFHLDAATMQAAVQMAVAAAGGRRELPLQFKGVMRVVMSPTLLRYFIETACNLTKEIVAATPGIDESPTVEASQ